MADLQGEVRRRPAKDPENQRTSAVEETELPPQSRLEKIGNLCWSLAFLGAACYALWDARFLHKMFYSHRVNRFMFDVGVVAMSINFGLAVYLEGFRSMYMKEKVNYDGARTTTHAILLSFLVALLSFIVAVWPVWKFYTFGIVAAVLYGVLYQCLLLLPSDGFIMFWAILYFAFMHLYFGGSL